MIRAVWTYCQAQVRGRIRSETGASLVEYALLLALIAVVCVAAVTIIGQKAERSFDSTASAFD